MASPIRMSRKGATNSDGKFDWSDALIDAAISGGITGVTSFMTTQNAQGAILAGALAFLVWLGIKRGVVEKAAVH